jgi:hypothetical protein
MSRTRGRKFSLYTHPKTGVQIEIRFDPQSKQFLAWVQGEWISDCSLKTLEDQLAQALTASADLEWRPVIWAVLTLKSVGDGDQDFELNLDYDRFYAAQKPDGVLLRVEWAEKEDNRLRVAREVYWNSRHGVFTPPCSPSEGSRRREYYLSYSEALWVALGELHRRLVRLRDKLPELIATPEGRKRLEQLQADALLPAED